MPTPRPSAKTNPTTQSVIEFLRQVVEADQHPVPPPSDPFSPRAFRRHFELQCQRDATRLLPFDLSGPGEPVIYHGSFTMAHGPALNLARCWCRQCRADARTHRRMLLVLISGYPRVLQHVHLSSLTPIAKEHLP